MNGWQVIIQNENKIIYKKCYKIYIAHISYYSKSKIIYIDFEEINIPFKERDSNFSVLFKKLNTLLNWHREYTQDTAYSFTKLNMEEFQELAPTLKYDIDIFIEKIINLKAFI